MNETLEIYINSRKANNYYNGLISDALYLLPTIEVSQDENALISIKNAVIPYSFYNVNNTNNKLNYVVDGVNYTIYLIVGNYNVNTLKSHLIELVGNSFVITYISKTNKFIFTHSTDDFIFLSTSNCFEILGFKDNYNYSSFNLSLTSTISINLFTIKNIYVCSDNFILNNIDSNNHNKSNIICSIPVNGSMNSILFYEDNTKHLVYKLGNIQNLRLTLTDEDGELIDFNDVHYSITLEITIVKKINN
jgi:hypothetical protein